MASRARLGIDQAARLKRRIDFVETQSGGAKLHGKHLLAMSRRRPDGMSLGRLGLTVTKKVGNAVVRNRIKRMLREWMRLHGWVPAGWDLVLVAKESASRQLHPDDFGPDLSRILRQLA